MVSMVSVAAVRSVMSNAAAKASGMALRDLVGPPRIAAVDPDDRAGRSQAARDLEPEPAGRAGDQRDAPGEREAFEPRRDWTCH